MNFLAIAMPSRKKLNTYGVESPCGCLPGVGEERANPGWAFAWRFNAIGVELFPRRHGYSEEIISRLRLESVTPMALKPIFNNLIDVKTWLNLWRITLRKRNAYSVEKCVLIYYLWPNSLEYQWKRITIDLLIQSNKLFVNHQRRRCCAKIQMELASIMN